VYPLLIQLLNIDEKIFMLEDPTKFWDTRHKSVNEWQAGGDKALSIARNKAFYAHRLGLLVGILDDYFNRDSLTLLDAGCGKGWLSDQLSAQGHDVCGIDSSETAIDICKAHRQGTYAVSMLGDFNAVDLFDAVLCMDVLFHILDDDEWLKSVRNIASLLTVDGILVVADDPREERYVMGDYIVHRSMTEYEVALQELGFRLIESLPYRFGGNPNKFLVFQRA
jgi:2-polyprenyl-3-methyl-5-hydroxy-6-metoxy-1,4-benzoquinol methylase